MEIRTEGMRELLAALATVTENLPRETHIALKKATDPTKKALAKQVTDELYRIPQKTVKKVITTSSNRQMLTATVSLKKTKRLPLKIFRPKQTKLGVEAKISSRSKDRKFYPGAFIIKKFGGNVYQRPDGGRKIVRMFGPSPFGVIVKDSNKSAIVIDVAQEAIKKEFQKRINFLALKKAGKLAWQQSESTQ